MKLGPVTKLKKSNKIRSKDFEANSDVIVNFWFITNLEQSENRIPEA